MLTFVTKSESDSREFAITLGRFLRPGDTVMLSGDLGTGKSVMARGIAAALGVSGPMPSPSFPIMISYEGRCKVYHFDLYRLADPEEFYAAGLDEFLGGDGVSIVEWPQMGDIDPLPAVRMLLRRLDGDDDFRSIQMEMEEINDQEAILKALEGWRCRN